MRAVCCKCGTPRNAPQSKFCIGTDPDPVYHFNHCFCCVQQPPEKCLYCNVIRSLKTSESHTLCPGAGATARLHVFVYSDIWPPFPEERTAAPQILENIDLTNFNISEVRSLAHEAAELPQNSIEEEPTVLSDEYVEEHPAPIIADIKPKLERPARWVTTQEIAKWVNCPRCGFVKMSNKSWLRHAQKCGQDPQYHSQKFFIRLHTMAWCGKLVRDLLWDKHTHPEKGFCKICRISRETKKPLPYQPKMPPRPNESTLERKRRSRLNKSRRRRRKETQTDYT